MSNPAILEDQVDQAAFELASDKLAAAIKATGLILSDNQFNKVIEGICENLFHADDKLYFYSALYGITRVTRSLKGKVLKDEEELYDYADFISLKLYRFYTLLDLL